MWNGVICFMCWKTTDLRRSSNGNSFSGVELFFLFCIFCEKNIAWETIHSSYFPQKFETKVEAEDEAEVAEFELDVNL